MPRAFRSKLTHLLRNQGIDSALLFGVSVKAWNAFAGVLTLVLVSTLLSRPAQGYFYTFSSLLSLNVFLEMGLTSVLSNFAAHEFVHLQWGPRGELVGNERSRRRLLGLLARSTSWFMALAIIFAILIAPSGAWFLIRSAARHGAMQTMSMAMWIGPWIAAVITTSLNLLLGPWVSVLNGSKDVSNMNRILLRGRIIGTIAAWLSMYAGHGLYAVALAPLGGILSIAHYLATRRRALLLAAWSEYANPGSDPADRISLKQEIWPMQWRIAVSWMAGFFIFQLFNPLLFYYRGPIEAGRFGITLAAANTVLGVGVTWFLVKVPTFGRFIALRAWLDLDRTFARSMTGAIVSTVSAGTALLLVLAELAHHALLAQRFLPLGPSAILLLAITLSVVVDGLAIYLRAHKQEPLMAGSVLVGFVQAALSVWSVQRFGALGLAGTFLTVYALIALPGALLIWHTKRRQWHAIRLSG